MSRFVCIYNHPLLNPSYGDLRSLIFTRKPKGREKKNRSNYVAELSNLTAIEISMGDDICAMDDAICSELESESIEIIREVAATATKPVMLYSIGKDSSVMLRLAQKAFYPGPIPFPLMHIDTGWKFREMIVFRDRTAREIGFKLITYTNPRGAAEGIGPITH